MKFAQQRYLRLSGLPILGLLLFSSCSQNRQIPEQVNQPLQNPSSVKHILLAQSAPEQCRIALKADNQKILHEGSSGLFLLEKEPSSRVKEDCGGMSVTNESLSLPAQPKKKTNNSEDEISSLLKLLPAEEIGARSFIKSHPEFDGRGVTVAILDTGVELDHPMLKNTSTGETKVIDFQDFSGEGFVALESSPAVSGIEGSDFFQGTFKGSSLSAAEDLAAVDKFADLAVVSYLDAQGKRRVRIDTNNNHDFSDEVALTNYSEEHTFTKIGEKRSLTVSANVSADGKNVVLCFDDGSHGTHVAGISTGYQKDGLIGVAPGAKVLAAKIGDNRLSGGSTTTASMLLAIDYAASHGAQVVNLSYGIRAGSNIGKSAIDKYIDKVARDKGILFSISAGNEGPGLLTIGTPAAANLAITNGAYVSKQTARDNYGYLGVESDNTWFFSSVGPRLDGGLKPTLLAPGTAVSSVPLWDRAHQNYRGTSMASPEVTGGLALILSAANGLNLAKDRASVTSAVYESAKKVANLSLVEQGHGLMSVPDAVEKLKTLSGYAPDYDISVESPASPTGKGAGVFVRSSGQMTDGFVATITPVFSKNTPVEETDKLRTYELSTTESWIKTPSTFWTNGTAKTFLIKVDESVFATPGIHSGLIQAKEQGSNRVAFEIPVTLISPIAVGARENFVFSQTLSLAPGQTTRLFLDAPSGLTSVEAEINSDGPIIWSQLLDSEGRQLLDVRDSETNDPQPLVRAQANLKGGGLQELDVVAPAYNKRRATVTVTLRYYSFDFLVGPMISANQREVEIQNNFAAIKVTPKLSLVSAEATDSVIADKGMFQKAIGVTEFDKEHYEEIAFEVLTSKSVYDLMTDYPFRVFGTDGEVVASGGLEMKSLISFLLEEETKIGDFNLEIQGAFTESPPATWGFSLREIRNLKEKKLLWQGSRTKLDRNQRVTFTLPTAEMVIEGETRLKPCARLELVTPDNRVVQSHQICQ